MKKHFILFGLLIGLSATAQISTSAMTQENRWTYGGNVGLGFGSNNYFNVQVSPRVGYRLTEDLEAGVMGSVSFQSSRYYQSTMFGVGPFANYYLGRSFFLGTSFQQYFINYREKHTDYKYDKDESALYLGGGYMQRISNGAYFQIGVMYNVLWKNNSSIFSSGLVPNIGFVVGL